MGKKSVITKPNVTPLRPAKKAALYPEKFDERSRAEEAAPTVSDKSTPPEIAKSLSLEEARQVITRALSTHRDGDIPYRNLRRHPCRSRLGSKGLKEDAHRHADDRGGA